MPRAGFSRRPARATVRPHQAQANRMLILATILLASALASFTDWLFMDVLVHRRYAATPALWRPRGGAGRIAVSQIIGTVATAALVLLAARHAAPPVLLGLALWCGGALPICLQNWQWMNLHPAIAASHAAGWLARLMLASLCAAWLLP